LKKTVRCKGETEKAIRENYTLT